ncbi:MAG TPA: CDP-alcohol phosphatidyltransferase family protein [Balneolaceae bacterium]|nr:CDP-alcohol phosphatidyltransferase family protein [Balneolaceae bacterium]
MDDRVHVVSEQKISSALFTWSNLISFSRIFIAFPVIILHYRNGMKPTWGIAVLLFYGVISDYLDGYIARKTGNISEWGKIFDPVADKISAFLLFGYAVWAGLIPLWFFLIELVRDLLILGGSLYIQQRRGKVAMAEMSGKWCVNALAAYWLCAFFGPEVMPPQLIFMGCSLSLMVLSFVDYIHRFNQIRQGAAFK